MNKMHFQEYDAELQRRSTCIGREISDEFSRITYLNEKKNHRLERESRVEEFVAEIVFTTPLSKIWERISEFRKKNCEAKDFLQHTFVQAKQTVYKRYCRKNLYLLIQKADYAPETGKEEAYLRFLEQAQLVDEVASLFQEKEEREFLRLSSLPSTEEGKVKYEAIIKKMQSSGYLAQGTAHKLRRYFFPDKKIATPGKISSSGKVENNNITKILPVPSLTEERPGKTRNDAEEISDHLTEIHDKLEVRVGQEYATVLIQLNPEIFSYRKQGRLASYLKALKQVQQRIKNNPERENELEHKFGIGNNLHAYSSLEELNELKERLYAETVFSEQSEDLLAGSLELHLAEYSFLHRNDTFVVSRLDSLITTGSVTVKEHEHWTSADTGARSLHILKKIAFQMKKAYAELGLPEPACVMNHGARTLSIDKESRIRLRDVRELAYTLQRTN